jgi:hypothetical protein
MSSTNGVLAEGRPQGLASNPDHLAKAWLRARVRLMPGLLSQSPPWVRGVFDHTWAPMEAMARQIQGLPPAWWDFLLSLDSGFVAISRGDSEYVPGPARIRQQSVENVARVSVADLAQDNEQPLHVLGHLLDHHLGCGGAAEGRWLSEGGGLVPEWQRAGERLPRLFSLGYAVDNVAESSVQDYFAQSLALYCRDRQRLNTADPQIYKWLRGTLWDKAFWRAEKRKRGNEEEND